MNIYQLVLYKNAQAIQDLDDYQVKKHNCHIEVRKEKEPGVSIDTALESLEELDKLMRQPPHHPREVR